MLTDFRKNTKNEKNTGQSTQSSMLAAILSSFEETSRVFDDKEVGLGINTIRRIAQRYANRAKIAQRIEQYPFAETLGQRRVIVSTDGGRIRIRKNKPGPRTKKGRRRYTTHWREPKLLMIYTVDEHEKIDRSFTPIIEGIWSTLFSSHATGNK